MPVFLKNNKVLIKDNKVAIDENCCICGCSCISVAASAHRCGWTPFVDGGNTYTNKDDSCPGCLDGFPDPDNPSVTTYTGGTSDTVFRVLTLTTDCCPSCGTIDLPDEPCDGFPRSACFPTGCFCTGSATSVMDLTPTANPNCGISFPCLVTYLNFGFLSYPDGSPIFDPEITLCTGTISGSITQGTIAGGGCCLFTDPDNSDDITKIFGNGCYDGGASLAYCSGGLILQCTHNVWQLTVPVTDDQIVADSESQLPAYPEYGGPFDSGQSDTCSSYKSWTSDEPSSYTIRRFKFKCPFEASVFDRTIYWTEHFTPDPITGTGSEYDSPQSDTVPAGSTEYEHEVFEPGDPFNSDTNGTISVSTGTIYIA